MASKQKPKRARLNRDVVVGAAVDYADLYGVEKLSMRELAKRLDCGVMSLYNHINDRDDLIYHMVDAIAADIELPARRDGEDTWAEELTRCCISAFKVMLKHHWAPKVWGQGNGPKKNDYHESILRTLREAGFSEELTCRSYHALTMHVVGFSLQVLELRPLMDTTQKVQDLGSRVLEELSAERYPYMREHVRFHMSAKETPNDFKFILELIIDGLVKSKAAAA